MILSIEEKPAQRLRFIEHGETKGDSRGERLRANSTDTLSEINLRIREDDR